MIVISLLFFLLGVGLLAAGLVIESIQLELGAVASALVSALALYAGVRQRRGVEEHGGASTEASKELLTGPPGGGSADEVWSPPPPNEPWPTGPIGESSTPPAQEPAEPPPLRESRWAQQDANAASVDATVEAEQPDEPDSSDIPTPDDEPPEEEVSPANVARVAARSDDVLVVDGRPRYHRRACSSLIGRETVPLPVSEAREAGFTPCARCRPDAHLLGNLERPQRR